MSSWLTIICFIFQFVSNYYNNVINYFLSPREKKMKPKYWSIMKSIFRRWFRNPKSPGSTPSRGHPRVTWLKLLLSSNLETFSIGRPESLESLFWVRSGQVMKTSGDALLTVSRFLRLPTNPSCTNIQIQ